LASIAFEGATSATKKASFDSLIVSPITGRKWTRWLFRSENHAARGSHIIAARNRHAIRRRERNRNGLSRGHESKIGIKTFVTPVFSLHNNCSAMLIDGRDVMTFTAIASLLPYEPSNFAAYCARMNRDHPRICRDKSDYHIGACSTGEGA
jgi:hypothetical protein